MALVLSAAQITEIDAELNTPIALGAAKLARLRVAALRMVESYVGAAGTETNDDIPDEIVTEAIIRTAGYMNRTERSGDVKSHKIGTLEVERVVTIGNPLRRSGALALITPWAPAFEVPDPDDA